MSPRTPWGTYHQIADALRSRIASKELAPGDAVPSEAALGREFGVARTTVRRALAELESERLIRAVPGTGRVVCTTEERERTPGGGPPPSQYRRIAAELRERIAGGDLAPGDALPSEAALVRQYGVSRGTARQALSELEGTGLVIAVHGKGRFVQGSETSTS
ncbi:GntR family transcriptional regulator [Streptomonospora nanhaiensis]|uniref:GntR family transcriptional regulator n=1 Tax=Streptomonospora nanhaiensis TaxID=1323731 RepID=A0ABY6YN56_9ACTN|nr:GntR family transcriptional regulator [Streptomonospora nanhaiensis]WAE73653.1 GntR family transcriptional regulator [Streptomonospora nanhaiensis]